MAAMLVRQSIIFKPMVRTKFHLHLTDSRSISQIFPCARASASLHTVVATEDSSGERYKHTITSGSHTFRGDLGEAWGAGGTAPEPKDYAFAGLAMCSSMTIRLYADRKKWQLRRVEVTVQEIGGRAGSLSDGLQMIVSLEGDLTDAQKDRLIEVSANCPVKQMMLGKMPNGIVVQRSS